MSHGIHKCRSCREVVMQCRCMDHDEVYFDMKCEKCKTIEQKQPSNNEAITRCILSHSNVDLIKQAAEYVLALETFVKDCAESSCYLHALKARELIND